MKNVKDKQRNKYLFLEIKLELRGKWMVEDLFKQEQNLWNNFNKLWANKKWDKFMTTKIKWEWLLKYPKGNQKPKKK